MSTEWVGAPIPDTLATRARELVAGIRAGRLTQQDAELVAGVVIEITETVMRHTFQRPVRILGLNAALSGIIDFGVGSSVKACRYGIRKVMPKLKDEQWTQLADFIEEALIRVP